MRLASVARPVAWVICGVLASIYVHSDLQSFSLALGWRWDVAEWMVDMGLGERMASSWLVVSLYIPRWLVAAMLGLVIGLCSAKKWFGASLACGIGYVLTPEICFFIYVSPNPAAYFGWGSWLQSVAYSALSAVVMVLSAMAAARIIHRYQANTPSPESGCGETSHI